MGCLSNKFFRLKFRHRSTVSGVVANGDHIKEKDDNDDDDYGARKYSWDDIVSLTMNFSRWIGSGGFSMVYLAQFPGSILGAVKTHAGSNHLNRLFKQELDILLRIRHDNIVRLLGYCDDEEGDALVFEFVPNGSLQDKLHSVERDTKLSWAWPVLSWQRRMAIAFQLAQAIEYLHEKHTPQIVHGDIKASNILLDEHLNCKLCDFGSANMGFSSMVVHSSRTKQVMMGSPGYTDPQYLRTGIATKKNDVYSYGVIILELVTGMEAFCEERGQLLTSIMGPVLKDAHDCEAIKVAQIVDPRLEGEFDLKEARAMLTLSALCLGHSAILRPSATQILDIFRENIPSISFLFSVGKDLPNFRNSRT
ncbi:hypothetical protein JCGZ_20346 [Jatropha curcas]|uniref:non-specific serine/threonine protein kinase n=1 Tax=Jatropha curcas TaxID=180498 RepID=A0A067JYW9_JATCU|nr:probable receptor-like protein kinase At4g10390 [Jatropha curcas]KDP25190.1 hypothetical protein JCGZ_20346 [Jatropha curcas]